MDELPLICEITYTKKINGFQNNAPLIWPMADAQICYFLMK